MLNLANKIRIFKSKYPDVWNVDINKHNQRNVICPEDKNLQFCYFKLLNEPKSLNGFSKIYVLINNKNNVKSYNSIKNDLKIKVLWTDQKLDKLLDSKEQLKKLENNDYKVSDQNKINLPGNSAIIFAIYKNNLQNIKNDYPSFT